MVNVARINAHAGARQAAAVVSHPRFNAAFRERAVFVIAKEAIGLALDIENNRVFVGNLDGNLYCGTLEGSEFRILYSTKAKEMFTGIAYVSNGLAPNKN